MTGGPARDAGEAGAYLDNNATTRILPEVGEAMLSAASDGFGNASSAHHRGRAARRALEEARERVAALAGAEPEETVFTSGGTEANNQALHGVLGGGSRRLVTTAAEHSSVLSKASALRGLGVSVVELPVGPDGLLALGDLEAALAEPADLVSVHWANSETGVIQPVAEIAALCARKGVPLHVDAAQAAGRLRLGFGDCGASLMSLTAHKLHGPQGVGALVARRGAAGLPPLLHGGDQEGGLRPGTQNLPGIAGFGKAAEVRLGCLERAQAGMRELRDAFERAVLDGVPGATVNGAAGSRVCNTSNMRFPGVDGTALMASLDREGIACSQGSACASMRPEPSHVLRAMGLSEEDAYSSVRFSLSVLSVRGEVADAAARVVRAARRLSGTA